LASRNIIADARFGTGARFLFFCRGSLVVVFEVDGLAGERLDRAEHRLEIVTCSSHFHLAILSDNEGDLVGGGDAEMPADFGRQRDLNLAADRGRSLNHQQSP
jgi:hypothetical protein